MPDRLVARVRAEFQEMPGLRLTLAQASRLFAIDRATCLAVLERLITERVISKAGDDTYVAVQPGAGDTSRVAGSPTSKNLR